MNSEAVSTELALVFKRDYSKLLAVLTRLFGPHNLDLAEDVLQDAFNKALSHWQKNGAPDNPSAWLTAVAKNQALDVIRANKSRTKFADDLSLLLESEWSLQATIEHEFNDTNIKDDQLRMIFMCCREDLSPENRLPLILRSLCGLSIHAVAKALCIPEQTVKKRLVRTREKLKQAQFELPQKEKLAAAMDTVHTALYLLFNEGFHSNDAGRAVNELFCLEALNLANVLMAEPRIVNRDTCGLLALMNYHLARLPSKVDEDGKNIPVDLQDRSLWDQERIHRADWLLSFAETHLPNIYGRFYVEAQIAREHCKVSVFEDTDWLAIVKHYEALVEVTGSPLAQLNKTIALAYSGAFDQALSDIRILSEDAFFQRSPAAIATQAHILALQGDHQAWEVLKNMQRYDGAETDYHAAYEQIERHLGAEKG